MAAAEDNPAGYYVGRPMNYGEEQAPEQPAKKVVDEQVNAPAQGVPGYYAVRVGQGNTSASAQVSASEPGFLAKCLVCFSGGGNAR
ncbi:hypothetical protein QOZ80_6AG0517760 [Eleusine coracana subsp. coracana]|nr:hypothetical protein QOZ80_6AG0517760 [Eleusine coracana subsp. coracana]